MSGSAIQQDRRSRVEELRKNRTRSPFLAIVGTVLGVGVIWAWMSAGPLFGRLSSERRWQNFLNFLEELVPSPVQKSGNWAEAIPWAWELFIDDGFVALMTTLGIATAAIILAAMVVLPLLVLASRQLSRVSPFGLRSGRTRRMRVVFWRFIGPVIRFGFVLARAIPEYLIAFLLLSLLGLQVWPLVLALAIHNSGILGRLWGEVIENAETAPARNAMASGTGRASAYATRMLPAVFNRFLIYIFYRWETCVKDATVLGMLGLLTLGKLIALSKGFFWDQMLFYILLGSAVILVSDLFSTWLRRHLR